MRDAQILLHVTAEQVCVSGGLMTQFLTSSWWSAAPASSSLLTLLCFACSPLLCKWLRMWREQCSLLRDRRDMQCEVLAPGLVILRGALHSASQLMLAEMILRLGHRDRRWWEWSCVNKKDVLVLNNHRQGRGRIYDALRSYPGEEEDGSQLLRRVCLEAAELARQLDKTMPILDLPTHLLVLFYTTARKLGWHRDNGANMELLS